MKLHVSTLLRAGLLGAALAAALPLKGAEDYETWILLRPYDLGSASRAIPSPAYTNTLNTFIPDNDGSYVAIWDLEDSRIAPNALVERRDAAGNLVWSWSPPEPKPDPQESTRAVIAGRTHVLWASSQRWYYLALADGTVTRSNEWSLPYLDATRLVPQKDLLYVLFDTYASVYDTNMDRVGTIELNWPAGYWRVHNGEWMLDLSQRTTRTLRVARLGPNLSVSQVWEIPLSHTRAGGYLDNRVLGADNNGLFVASTLSWPDQATTYFTYLNAGGQVRFQHRLGANQMITGATVVTNGWVLSAQFLGESSSRHTLYRLDNYGRPYWQVRFASDPTQQNVALNTNPPRLLRFNKSTPWELRELERKDWWTVWDRLLWNLPMHGVELYWDSNAFDISGILSRTDHFWREPARLNNT